MRNFLKNLLLALVVFLVIAGLFALYRTPQEKPEEVSLSTVAQEINEEKIKKIEIEENKLAIELQDETKQTAVKEPEAALSETLANYGVAQDKLAKIEIEIKEKSGFAYWMGAILPFLLPFIFIALFIYLMSRQVQRGQSRAMMFGQTKAKPVEKNKKEKITFGDVAGVKEAKEELKEIVEFLKTPEKFTSLGARVPKGVLLLGPPGTGKTLLARAVAGEAKVPFFHISGSEFVEMFVGVGASRVRDLFNKAKKNAPAILFIDEIDAVGRMRGAGLGGSHDEREQTLNQILTEMDGFERGTRVIVMAATNRPDVLDPALLRPGRFDRRIVLIMPDVKEREAILKIHSKGKPLARGVSLEELAQRTPGFSGADLENLMNEAAILSARSNKKEVGMKECIESIEKVLLGPERKSHLLSKKEKRIAAFHEAGHALVAHILPHPDPIRKVSIISRGQVAGYTLKLPEADKHFHSKAEFLDELAVLLAGFVAEKKTFGDITTGATSDLRLATQLARKLVTEYGMSEKLGPQTFGQKEELIFLGREIAEQKDYSESVAYEIDKEVRDLIAQAQKTARLVISKHKEKLNKLAETLVEKEAIERKELEKILGKKKRS